ncbi:MAG TPA: serine/threonine-protein kinase, partial [Gemmatimonadales bacterium]|nr:serine/threonine-protein kinase [Gemmatimonadales bacterium]
MADRYRVVGLLGKGGMGEVYRADDLKLGQPVALKFLPEALQDDAERLERFYHEVRIAREVSHPAVCRVHDIGEIEGRPFLSMEYVDGENLSSLLRRIGRLPRDKALDIARQVSAGLAAAHSKGVLHRDLKPDNVMLDGRGKARLTDFGLAAAVASVRGADVRSGTPAYMSPEQISGREVTLKSDLYSLGLVLYELVTGKRMFDGRTLTELARQHQEQEPVRPSVLVDDLDPAVERVILNCLEKDPRNRPASALAVAAALSGGDALAAALAVGETPSPELVAAAGRQGGLSPAQAWASVAVLAASLLAAPFLAKRLLLVHQVPMEKPPAVLEDRAREFLRKLGRGAKSADSGSGFSLDRDYLRRVAATDRSKDRWLGLRTGQPPVVQFWYRESPRDMVPVANTESTIGWWDPPIVITDMVGVRYDMRGRLLEFYAVPPHKEEPQAASAP